MLYAAMGSSCWIRYTWGGTEVSKSRSETLLRGTASSTFIEKSVHKQGLVSSNLQGETRGRNFTSVNGIRSPASLRTPAGPCSRGLARLRERKADGSLSPGPGERVALGARQRRVTSPSLREGGGRDDLLFPVPRGHTIRPQNLSPPDAAGLIADLVRLRPYTQQRG